MITETRSESSNAAARLEIPVNPAGIPAELKVIPRWLLWRLEDRAGKPSKTPYQVSGELAKVNDPDTWTDFDTALAAYRAGGWSGLGIALSDDDDLAGVDLDKCLNPDTGELDPEAAALVAMLPTYCEISPSGRGLRLFAFGKLPQGGRRKGKVEMYESGRYLTVTGHQFNGHDSIAECTAELAAVHARIFASGAGKTPVDSNPRPADPSDIDDAALLDKARRARNGGEFDRLWNGDLSAHGGDASAADLALCNLLAFWTGDPARIDRLFRLSALFRPAKWDKVHYSDGRTYGQATIEKAMDGNRETYSGRKPGPIIARPATATRPENAAPEPPHRMERLRIEPGKLAERTDDAELALLKYHGNLYQRADQLVRIRIATPETVRGIQIYPGIPIIAPVDVEYLTDQMNRLVGWEKFNERRHDWVTSDAPRQIAAALLSRVGDWKAPRLAGLTTAPTLRPDGSLFDQPGYDAKTGLLFVDQGARFPTIPAAPSKDAGRAALDYLVESVLSEFPFTAPHHRSVALSAILTGLVRQSMPAAPVHAFTSPRAGCGKSLLTDTVALIATGACATSLSFVPDQDELRKQLLSGLLSGTSVMCFDNVEEVMTGKELCRATTEPTYTGRVLGTNSLVTVPVICTWLANGINMRFGNDFTRRVVLCEVDPNCERPEDRQCSRNLREWIPANRPALVSAGLTALRAYIAAGKPGVNIKSLGSYEVWSGLVRAALIWLGEADPLLGRDEIEAFDPVKTKLRALILAWYHAFGTAPAICNYAINRAVSTYRDDDGNEISEAPELREVLLQHFVNPRGEICARSLGNFLSETVKRVEAGARIEVAGTSQRAVKWRVVPVHRGALDKALQEFRQG